MIKFMIVFICFIIALFGGKKERLLITALFFTVLADFCIILMGERWCTLGIFFFCIVQMFYYVRHTGKHPSFLHAGAVIIGIVVFLLTTDSLLAISATYACFLALSVYAVYRIIFTKQIVFSNKNRLLICLGITLFLFCDICVMLFNLPRFVENTIYVQIIAETALALIWVFYAPSQLFLALSRIDGKTA